ncbi:hypothetical protein J3F83DRAFT_9732 [Trichoderma novae-zelandiae]
MMDCLGRMTPNPGTTRDGPPGFDCLCTSSSRENPRTTSTYIRTWVPSVAGTHACPSPQLLLAGGTTTGGRPTGNQTDTAGSHKAEANEEESTQNGAGAGRRGQRPRRQFAVCLGTNAALVFSREYGYGVIAKVPRTRCREPQIAKQHQGQMKVMTDPRCFSPWGRTLRIGAGTRSSTRCPKKKKRLSSVHALESPRAKNRYKRRIHATEEFFSLAASAQVEA